MGHSLGELSALHWAEAFRWRHTVRIAAARGQAMSDLASAAGAMASLAADQDEVEALLDGEPVVDRGPERPPPDGRLRACGRRRRSSSPGRAERGFAATAAAGRACVPLADGGRGRDPRWPRLAQRPIGRLRRTVVSTVTGARLAADADSR